MKVVKISLATVKNKLSRNEMKQVMAGSGGSDCNSDKLCRSGCSSNGVCNSCCIA